MKSTKPHSLWSSPNVFFLIAAIIISCNNPDNSPAIKNDDPIAVPQQSVFDKLTGTWQSEDGKSFERWTKNENGTYRSAGFSIKAGDTSLNEQANIYHENNNWIFENTVKGQNDGKAIKFISSVLDENSVQFSNPAHDFPTDINYTITNANSLKAFIVGPNNRGGKDTISFNFRRVN